jgi:type II secretory pathway pseudopilin PulG
MITPHQLNRTRGVTLVETVAALALLGTLVALSFSSRSNINKQYTHANLKFQATELADQQIQHWHDTVPTPPLRESGPMIGHPDWTWRTTVINDPDLLPLKLSILHLQIFAPTALRSEPGPVLTLELVIPAEDRRNG